MIFFTTCTSEPFHDYIYFLVGFGVKKDKINEITYCDDLSYVFLRNVFLATSKFFLIFSSFIKSPSSFPHRLCAQGVSIKCMLKILNAKF